MGRKKTTEEFIADAKKVHGDRYLYNKTVYINSKKDVIITCREHGDFPQRATNHLQGRGCDDCGGSAYKSDEELKLIMENNNLNNKNYKINKIYRIEENGYNKIKCDCQCLIDGFEWSIPLTCLERTDVCPQCNNCIKTYTIDTIKDLIKSKHPNITILSDKYIGSKEDLICMCNIHNIRFEKSFDEIIHQVYPCEKCHRHAFMGENNPTWNPNLTEEDRILGRKIKCNETGIGIDEWRKMVYERDNYTCVITGIIGQKLNAHHLNGWHWCNDGRFDINNGVTLSKTIHKEFHKIYGIRNNTREQFEEFYFNKTGKEFKHILEGEK